MRTTVTIDDELFAAASTAVGTSERAAVLREALHALIEREAARRLARLGATDAKAHAGPRRRNPPKPASGRRASP